MLHTQRHTEPTESNSCSCISVFRADFLRLNSLSRHLSLRKLILPFLATTDCLRSSSRGDLGTFASFVLACHLVWALSRVPAQRMVSPTTEMSSHIHCDLENSSHASSEVNINLENLSQLCPEACFLPDSRPCQVGNANHQRVFLLDLNA